VCVYIYLFFGVCFCFVLFVGITLQVSCPNDMLSLSTQVLVQNKRNGEVITIIDNRAALALNRMTSGASQEGKDVMTKLLTGGSK
jgi:hypothetical protein